MRIVDREEFLALPPGTVYWKYTPCVTSEMSIKEQTLWNEKHLLRSDWVCQDIDPIQNLVGVRVLSHEILEGMEADSSLDVPVLFDSCGRDGFFDEDQLFCVMSVADVLGMIKRLQEAVADSSAKHEGVESGEEAGAETDDGHGTLESCRMRSPWSGGLGGRGIIRD